MLVHFGFDTDVFLNADLLGRLMNIKIYFIWVEPYHEFVGANLQTLKGSDNL